MIEILSSTAMASVQDMGRDGFLRYGVGTSGAMDRVALAGGNLVCQSFGDVFQGAGDGIGR